MANDDPVWDADRLSNPHVHADKSVRVRRMFDAIAPTYERVNRWFSFGIDTAWRRRLIALADCRSTDTVLDVCTGTGDLARMFCDQRSRPSSVFGIDFAMNMLSGGAGRTRPGLFYVQGDALNLPLHDGCCDVVSCAFGVRNFQFLKEGLAEFRRVLRPGGRLVILEFSRPSRRWVRWGYEIYAARIMPTLATWVSGDRTGAYRYLPQSVISFPDVQSLCRLLAEVGFSEVTTHAQTQGVVTIYVARVHDVG